MPILIDAKGNRTDKESGLLPLLKAAGGQHTDVVKVQVVGGHSFIMLLEALESMVGVVKREVFAADNTTELFVFVFERSVSGRAPETRNLW